MQRSLTQSLLVLLLAIIVSGCSVIGGVFKAGFAVGIFLVVIVLIVLFMLFGRR